MRYMLLVKADERSEAGELPSREMLAEMGRFNDEMIRAGVMLAGDGLQASSKGVRIDFTGDRPKVIDGPFTEAKELVAGYWIIQVKSREEAIEWASRAPFKEGVLEVRQVYEVTDFPADVLPPEEAAREQAFRDEQQAKAQQGG